MKINIKHISVAIILILFLISATNIVFAYTDGHMKIEGCVIQAGDASDGRTHAYIYLGKQYTGEDVKIQIFYSYHGKNLNKGKKVNKTVQGNGFIDVYSAKPLKHNPDFAKINLYDSYGYLIDSLSINLSTTKRIQEFYAPGSSISPTKNVQSSYSSNKNSYHKKTYGTYIGNKKTGKFHYDGCSGVNRMKNSNKVYFSCREDAVSRGYSSCGLCNP